MSLVFHWYMAPWRLFPDRSGLELKDVDGELTASDVLLTAGVSGDDSGWNATMSRIQTLVQQETDTANQFETTASTVPSS